MRTAATRTPSPRAALLLAVLCLASAAACGRAQAVNCTDEEHPPEQSGGHLLGDAAPPVPYSSQPPTSGWHSSGAPRFGLRGDGDPLSEAEQVTVLEVGGVVVSYRQLDDQALAELRDTVASLPRRTVAATSYDVLEPGAVVFSAWGVLQRCDGFDPARLRAFLDAHRGGGPAH